MFGYEDGTFKKRNAQEFGTIQKKNTVTQRHTYRHLKKKYNNCSQKQTNKRKTRYVYRPWLFSSHAE